jgi:hypothetical protein
MKKTGSSVICRQDHPSDVGSGVTLRDTLHLLQHDLDITDRQSRAIVSSYRSEGWMLETYTGGLNEPIFEAGSLEVRVRRHLEARDASRVQNGKLGGRPRACPVSASSGGLTSHIETGVVSPDEPQPAMFRVSGII